MGVAPPPPPPPTLRGFLCHKRRGLNIEGNKLKDATLIIDFFNSKDLSAIYPLKIAGGQRKKEAFK